MDSTQSSEDNLTRLREAGLLTEESRSALDSSQQEVLENLSSDEVTFLIDLWQKTGPIEFGPMWI